MWDRLKNSKTFWTATVGVLGSIAGEVSGTVSSEQMQSFQAIALMLIGVFLRDGVEKAK